MASTQEFVILNKTNVNTQTFIASILKQDRNARIIAGGDFNEFTYVAPLEYFTKISQLLDLDDVAKIPKTERYTYVFDMSCQQLDHIFVSSALAKKKVAYEHLHINTWDTVANQVSDHDPSIARLDVCQ
jgi:predicted extracellular nuclease